MTEIRRRLRWAKRARKRTRAPAPPAARAPRRTPTLLIMLRAPGVGRGKSRLAAGVGRAEAWRIQRLLQARTLRIAHDRRWRTILCVTPDSAVRAPISGWPARMERIVQGPGDLGARLSRALRGRKDVAVIGTDCPQLTRGHIAEAFAALKRAAFAIGPCTDGGFWILAARDGDAAAGAMAGVRWSCAQTLDDVLGRLGALPAELATLRDVDTAADLATLRRARSLKTTKSGPVGGAIGPAT
jgi:hypothetical protein